MAKQRVTNVPVQEFGEIVKLYHPRCASNNVKLIYKITCPNNNVYIGQTRNLYKRLVAHKISTDINPLYTSIATYGWVNHICEVLQEFPADIKKETVDLYEDLYMEFYRNAGIELYNVRGGGINGKIAEETKLKISKFNKGKIIPEDVRIKISIANKGKKKSPEHILKSMATKVLRGCNIGRKLTQETKDKIRLKHLGKPKPKHTEEAKIKIGLASKGNKHRLGTKNKPKPLVPIS